MTKPTRSKAGKPPRDVLGDLAALGGEMMVLAATFELRKPDALEQAAFYRSRHALTAERMRKLERQITKGIVTLENDPEQAATKAGAIAAQQEPIVRAIDAVVARYSKIAPTWQTDEGQTPEKRVQKAWDRDPILVLLEGKKITADQAKAARHMAAVFHGMTAAIMPRVGKMDPTPGAPRDSGWKEPTLSGMAATAHARVYKPWADEMLPKAGVPLPVMVEICIDGHALNTVATRHRLWHRTVLKLLRKGLDLYDDRLRSHGGKSDREFSMSDLPAHLLEHKELTTEGAQTPTP